MMMPSKSKISALIIGELNQQILVIAFVNADEHEHESCLTAHP